MAQQRAMCFVPDIVVCTEGEKHESCLNPLCLVAVCPHERTALLFAAKLKERKKNCS